MDEKTTHDGRTAMERLARELMCAVCDFADASRSWCKKNNVDLRWANRSLRMELACYDIERRIYEARREDMETFKELINARAELDALREAGRVMPEGVSWPRYTDGGPVRIGDEMVLGRVHEVSVTAGGCSLTGSGGSILAEVPSGVLIHRPAHKAVGADDREVKAGDTVWDEIGREWEVVAVSVNGCHLKSTDSAAQCRTGRIYVDPDLLTRERPDSWERLREDAVKIMSEYWGCAGHHCEECPSKVGGKTPAGRYGVDWCDEAMRLDIVARAERLAGVRGDE